MVWQQWCTEERAEEKEKKENLEMKDWDESNTSTTVYF